MAQADKAADKASAPRRRQRRRTTTGSPGAAAASTAASAAANCPVLGVGASAGGLEAVSALLAALPPDPGLAVVVIQHLDPANKSLLVELLARQTGMPVQPAAEGLTVAANRVYVIPPGCYLAIVNGRLQLSAAPSHTLRLPVDCFLRSLARDRANRAIGVVLSGTGSDGTLGLKAIQEAGGLTLVQDPEEAAHGGMPRSAIKAGAADHVLPVRDMPAAVLRYVAQDYAKAGGTQATDARGEDAEARAAQIVEAVRAAIGEDFALYRTGTLLRRVARRMALTGTHDFSVYYARLRNDATEAGALARDLLINVTSFFRDRAAFAFLAEHVLPTLVARHGNDEPIRVWSAGCATGEEAYSLAILLLEQIASAGKRTRVQVFATDTDAEALEVARAGVYPDSIEADLSAEHLERFFTRTDHTYTVNTALRKTIVFARHNLLRDAPFSGLDLIACRNLLIYLRPEAQQRVLSLFHFALRDHGILFLGSAESLGEATNLFDPIDRTHRIFQLIRQLHRPRVGHPRLWRPDAPAEPLPAARPLRRTLADLAQRTLLENYAPASVIIDRKRRGLYFSGPIDRFLRLATGTPEQDVLSMAREGLQPRLRTAIERAFRTDKRVTVHGAQVKRAAKTARVTIEVRPVAKADDELLLISFIDEPAAVAGKAAVPSGAEQEAVALLQTELDSTRKELSRTIRDLERSNEEITGANEEVISMNEELQATNEELETSEEELQSRNKELATLNTQLRQSLDAQSVAADDLTNLLNSTGIATLFLDARLRIKFFNPPASALFSAISSDVGRPLNDLAQKFADPSLLADAGSVLATGAQVQREIEDERGMWYSQTILPYRTASGATDGVVITFADITAVKTAELAADRARVYAETIVNTIHEPLVVLGPARRIVSANPAFMTAFGLPQGSAEGRSLQALDNKLLRDPRLGEVVDRLAGEVDRVADQQITVEDADGGRRTLRLNGSRLPDGPPDAPMILLGIEDFTERQRTIEQQFRGFLDAMPEPMMTVGEDSRIRWVNGEFERLFGYRHDELAGQSIDVLVPADRRERHRLLHTAYLRDPSPRAMARGLEIHGLTKDARVLPLEILLSPIRTSIGLLVTAAVRDLSARREGEQVLNDARAQAQRANRAKTRFLQAASHNLRQPLQVIRLLRGVLGAQVTDAAGNATLARLDDTVDAMTGVLDAFLDVSQIESGTITPSAVAFSASGMCSRLRSEFGTLAAAKGLALRMVPCHATIRSDPRLLERILGNLLANAIKYTRTGKILLGARRRGTTLRIEVWDTGVGIPPAHLANIFEEFYQVEPLANRSGASVGIGLYIAERLARLLDHPLDVRSTPGKGTVFAITVPLAEPGAAGTAAAAPAAAGATDGAAVLVVEDDQAQRNSLRLLLSVQGYAVETADSAAAALALVGSASGFRPDIIVADYNLAGGPSGLEVVQRIAAARGRPVPALIITGDPSARTARTVAEAGYQLLRKPVRLAGLLQAVQDLAALAPGRPVPALRPPPAPSGTGAPAGGGATIAVIDDDRDVRDALRDMLATAGYGSVGHGSAEAFLDDPQRRGYACVLVDVGLPGMDGLALQRRLAGEQPSPPLIFITGDAELSRAVTAMRNGAADFLEKPVRPEALLASVARARLGPRETAGDAATRREIEARIAALTPRQREVMQRMIDGQMNKNIAADLRIGQRTVEHHRSAVMKRMGARSLAGLVRMVAFRRP